MSFADFSTTDILLMAAGALVVLVIGWTILKAMLSFGVRIVTIGCLGILIVAAAVFALAYFSG